MIEKPAQARGSAHFYAELALNDLPLSELMADAQRFSAVPPDWHVVLTDVKKSTQALSNGMQSFNELGPAIEELRGVLSGLNDITTRLEEDPAGFLLGDDNIKEYQP